MDLKVPWKSLSKQDATSSKWGAFSSKQVAFFAIVGLALVAGIVLRFGQFFGEPTAEENAPVTVATPPPTATTPPVETPQSQVQTAPAVQQPAAPVEQSGQTAGTGEQTEQSGQPAEQTEQANQAGEQVEQPASLGSGTILVSRQPVAMLASPSSSAPTLYGFPAGRPFRVIGHSGGFAQIKDLRSGASGWIDEASLAPPPSSPTVSAPYQPRPATANARPAAPSAIPRSKATKKDSQVTVDSEEATDQVTPRRPGLFGRGGLFGGIFGGGNGN